jgi:hypothetical protein
LKHEGHGKYAPASNRLGMSGRYQAVISVTPASGDTVKQVFSFSK